MAVARFYSIDGACAGFPVPVIISNNFSYIVLCKARQRKKKRQQETGCVFFDTLYCWGTFHKGRFNAVVLRDNCHKGAIVKYAKNQFVRLIRRPGFSQWGKPPMCIGKAFGTAVTAARRKKKRGQGPRFFFLHK